MDHVIVQATFLGNAGARSLFTDENLRNMVLLYNDVSVELQVNFTKEVCNLKHSRKIRRWKSDSGSPLVWNFQIREFLELPRLWSVYRVTDAFFTVRDEYCLMQTHIIRQGNMYIISGTMAGTVKESTFKNNVPCTF